MSSCPLLMEVPGNDSDTLTLGRRLLLTIGEDSLVILDNNLDKSLLRSCCGSFGASRTRSIPLRELLWADVGEVTITLTFAQPVSKSSVKPDSLTYPYGQSDREAVNGWISRLLGRAYEGCLRSKRLKVVLNPFGGSGQAVKMFHTQAKPLLEAAHCTLDVEETRHSRHAIEIAAKLDIDSFDAVVCCSGDGVPHEIFNGFARRRDARDAFSKIAVCQLPGGSGNAMCWNLTGTGSASLAALAIIKGLRKPMDLVSVTQGDQRILSFLSQSLGMVADVDLGTEHLRWMGDLRFTVGILQRIIKQTVYPCDIAVKVVIDDRAAIRDHYRNAPAKGPCESDYSEGLPRLEFGTVNDPLPEDWKLVHYAEMGNFYAGNMAWVSAGTNLFPAAKPNDGMFDLLCTDGNLGRLEAAKTFLAVETGSHFDMPQVHYRKILAYRIIPHKRSGVSEEYISIDGERVPSAPMQAEVHAGLATVLASRDSYLAPGV